VILLPFVVVYYVLSNYSKKTLILRGAAA
jgi:hypothetical protein